MASDVKWFKFMNGMFDDEKIEYIESLPDGDAILIIWIRILCLASKCNENGLLMISNEIPYTPDLLAHKFKKTTTQVEYALGIMRKLGMIDIFEDIICVSNWAKYQSVDELAKIREQTRLRVAKCRENKKLEMNCTICQYCGSSATGFDHIIATSRGGSDKDENKVPCCIECNRIKNDKPLVDFLNNNRGRINDNIVTANKKLSRFVELCSVTGRYSVTQKCNDFALISSSNSISNSNSLDNNIIKDKSHKYGEYGWIKLTDKQYQKLCDEFTKEYIDAVIKEVDEYIQSNGNKNKYKDWNLVLRKSIKNQWSCLKDIKTVSQPKKNDDYVNVDISYIGKYGETVFDVYPRKKGQTEWTEEDKERILKEKGGKRWIY